MAELKENGSNNFMFKSNEKDDEKLEEDEKDNTHSKNNSEKQFSILFIAEQE
jgi:hypothetical protein